MSFKQVFTFKMYPFLSDFFFSWDNRDECPHLFQIIPRSSLRAVTVHRNHQCKVQPKELLAFGNHCAMSHVGLLDGQHFVWTAGVGWQMNHSSQNERPTISNLLGSSLTCHEPPSLWRMQSCSLYHQTQLSIACGEDSMICDCNGLPAGKDNCLTPHWHCSFYLCHLVLFSFLISGGLHVSETLFFFSPGAFPCRYFFLQIFCLLLEFTPSCWCLTGFLTWDTFPSTRGQHLTKNIQTQGSHLGTDPPTC